MKIQADDQTGAVILYPATEPQPKVGFTIREVSELPQGSGGLKWDGEKLVRVPAPEKQKTLLQKANAVFFQLPAPLQQAFAADFAIVRVLIEARQPELAKAHIASKQVPPEVQGLKDHLLSVFPDPTQPLG